MQDNKLMMLFFYVFYLALFPTLKANNVDHLDPVWQRRALEARNATHQAYRPNPEQVTIDFNKHVHKALNVSEGHTRRGLGQQVHGECSATNPIDSCWRCDPNWEKNRKKLADCVLGFAHGTTGGKAGRIYVVTDPSDNDLVNPKLGTLRHAVIQTEPLWIIFKQSMTIKLRAELLVTSDKTIDARGADVHIAGGAQITLQYVKNVIVHGLHIHDIKKTAGGLIRDSMKHYGIRGMSDGDGISLFGVSHVWLDHLSLSNCDDGLIDVVAGSTAVTISNCLMTRHKDVMLLGASDTFSGDEIMQVTVAFNHFGKDLVHRMPRCRWGYFHIVNNDYTEWIMYAIGGSTHPTILSQGNRFVAPPTNQFARQVTKRYYAPESVWKNWSWRSEGDLMVNGAFFVQSGEKVANPPKNDIIAKPGTFAATLTRFAGALNCVVNKPC